MSAEASVAAAVGEQGPQAGFAPRSILHAAENIKGGVGTYLRDLLQVQLGSFGPGIITVVVPAGQRDILGLLEGVEVITFDDRGHRLLSTARLALEMRRVVARMNPSVVHLHSTFAGAALRPLLRLIRTRAAVIYCAHGWAFDRESSRLSRVFAQLLERTLARWCDAVVCISDHEMWAASRIGIPAKKLIRVRNGIPRDNPRPVDQQVSAQGAPAATTSAQADASPRAVAQWPEGKRRVLFVGRFDRQKGTDLLIDAIAKLDDSVFAYFVGDTVLGDARSYVLPENARSTGWLSAEELEGFYQSADVLVVPSRWEGFGLNAVEAMRASLPVIASRVGGLPEVVQQGSTGLLVPPGDTNSLVAALRDTSDESLAAMGRAGRQRFLRLFTLDRVHEQLTELYELCLTRKAREA